METIYYTHTRASCLAYIPSNTLTRRSQTPNKPGRRQKRNLLSWKTTKTRSKSQTSFIEPSPLNSLATTIFSSSNVMLSAHLSPRLDHPSFPQARTDTYSHPHSSLPIPSLALPPPPSSPRRTLPRLDDNSSTAHETPYESGTYQPYRQGGQGGVSSSHMNSSGPSYLNRPGPGQTGTPGFGSGSGSAGGVESPTTISTPYVPVPRTPFSETVGSANYGQSYGHDRSHGHDQGQGQAYGGSYTGTPTFDLPHLPGQTEGSRNASSSSITITVPNSTDTPSLTMITNTTPTDRPVIEQPHQESANDRPKPKPKPRGKGKPKAQETSILEPTMRSKSKSKSKLETTKAIYRSDIPAEPYIIPPALSSNSSAGVGAGVGGSGGDIYPGLGQSGFPPSSECTAMAYSYGHQDAPTNRPSSSSQWRVEEEPAGSPLQSVVPYTQAPTYASGFELGSKSSSIAGYPAGLTGSSVHGLSGVSHTPNQYAPPSSGGYMDYHHQGPVHPHQSLGQSPYLHPSASITHSAPVSRHVSYNAQYEATSSVDGKGERLGSPAETMGGRRGGRSVSGLRVGIRSVSATEIRGVGADGESLQ
jgi:hypothetical protein